MFDVNDTLLPPTATPLAKALDILEERLFSLPVQMISKDPAKVDVGWLDHLAWENSVDTWDSDWPEDIKRRVIAVSAEVHRYKGTPYAIRTALAAFDVDTELLEWFEPEGVSGGLEAGSFSVTAFAGRSLYGESENVIDNRMLYALNAVVQRVAPVSRKLVFRLGERFSDGFYARVATGDGFRDHQSRRVEVDPVEVVPTVVPRARLRETLTDDGRIAPSGGDDFIFPFRALRMDVSYGQSLAGGSSSGEPWSQPFLRNSVSAKALMFRGGVRAGFGLSEVTPEGFGGLVRSVEALDASGLLSDTGMTAFGAEVSSDSAETCVVAAFGQGGAPYPVIEEGTQPFANLENAMVAAKAEADRVGAVFRFASVDWRHGESEADETLEAYLAMARDFRGDLYGAVETLLGQTSRPWICLRQISRSQRPDDFGAGGYVVAGPGQAVLYAAQSGEMGFTYSGPQYPGEFVDHFHMTPRSYNWMASMSAKAVLHSEKTGAPYMPLHVSRAWREGGWVLAELTGSHVRDGGRIVLDSGWVTDPGDLGVSVLRNGRRLTVRGVSAIGGAFLAVKLTEAAAAGDLLSIAGWSQDPMGRQGRNTGLRSCIRDDDPGVCRFTDWALHNYAMSQIIEVEG